MTSTPAPTPNQTHKPTESVSYRIWVLQKSQVCGKWAWQGTQLAANIYLATNPAQVFLAVGRGITPIVNELPYYGPNIAWGLEWGTFITAGAIDPVGFGISYTVRNVTKKIVEAGISKLEESNVNFDGDEKKQITGAIILAADVFLSPLIRSGLQSGGTWVSQSASEKLADNPDLAKHIEKWGDEISQNKYYQATENVFTAAGNRYSNFHTWSDTHFKNSQTFLVNSAIGITTKTFGEKVGQHPLTPKTFAFVAAGLSNKNAAIIASGVAGFVAEGIKEIQTQIKEMKQKPYNPYQMEYNYENPSTDDFTDNSFPLPPTQQHKRLT